MATEQNIDMHGNTVINHNRLVHFDLKGAPLCVEYLRKIFPYLKRFGASGILVEYEDSFPYDNELKFLAASHAYSKDDIKEILSIAAENDLFVIPLVQTFGHLEFALKHEQLRPIREVEKYPMALCPCNPDSLSLVCKMIDQVMALHTKIDYFHIGCDEVYHLGLCDRCQAYMEKESVGKEQLFFHHVMNVATYMKQKYEGIQCIIWDDMFRFSELPVILNCSLGGLVEPMIWHYIPSFMLPNDLWDKLSAVFPNIWVASAFKGATGPRATITNIQYHLDNQHAWVESLNSIKHKFKCVRGIVLTGWQRYDHYAVLCELFPHGLPCLALCLRFLEQGLLTPSEMEFVSKELKFSTPIPINPFTCREIPICNFPGSHIYQLTIEFVHTEAACNEFFKLDGIIAWMNEYNVERRFLNPVHVEPLLGRAESLLEALQNIKGKVRQSFPGVFIEGVQEEWEGVFLMPLLRKLKNFIQTSKEVTELSTRSPKELQEKEEEKT